MAAPVVKILREVDWKTFFTLAIQILTDPKVAGTIVFIGFVIYGIGYDTIFRPSLEQMKSLDDGLKQQREAFEAQKAEIQKFQTWSKELEGLAIHLPKIDNGQVGTVVAATQMGVIEEVLSGRNRNASAVEPLPSPHDKLTHTEIRQTDSSEVTIAAAPAQASSASTDSAIAKRGAPLESAAQGDVKLTRYDYEAKTTGTYPALADAINQLVLLSNLVVIRDISIASIPAQQDAERPDPKIQEDAAVPLEMTLKLSVYLVPEKKPGVGGTP